MCGGGRVSRLTRRELLAVVSSIKHFHHYLYGKDFVVRTDHGALTWLLNFKNPEGQVARWLEVLQTYNFKILHRPGLWHQIHGHGSSGQVVLLGNRGFLVLLKPRRQDMSGQRMGDRSVIFCRNVGHTENKCRKKRFERTPKN